MADEADKEIAADDPKGRAATDVGPNDSAEEDSVEETDAGADNPEADEPTHEGCKVVHQPDERKVSSASAVARQ